MHPGVCSDSTSNSNLRSLTINIGLSYSSMPCNGVRPDMLSCFPAPITSIRQLSITLDCNFLEDSEASQPGADFGTFIKALPNLLDFELQVVGEDWLEKPFGLLGSIIIPKLQKLTLECLKCREHELDDFLLRHKSTLTDIHFSAVHLDDDSQSWDRLLRNIKNGPNNPKIIMAECEPDGGMVDAYQRLYTSSEKDAS
ncbi:hypothetical protein FOMG_19851 [Fusarium oxysporum f. sp. melonis 26406]|uniref:F-box domain-containing protein n=1 Tax=Fusarium oxysporum f. sp. melonis 26406 TaxID=1089452 RepID=W9YUW9_FUSOX|nr:hypothetical protein FOMG_19851 [Fusarium oxysporum f. sp. melonis 26406]